MTAPVRTASVTSAPARASSTEISPAELPAPTTRTRLPFIAVRPPVVDAVDDATGEAIAAGNRRHVRIGDDAGGDDEVPRVDVRAGAQPQTPAAVVARRARHLGAGLDRQAERVGVAVEIVEEVAARRRRAAGPTAAAGPAAPRGAGRYAAPGCRRAWPTCGRPRRRLRARSAPRRPASARVTSRARRVRRRRRPRSRMGHLPAWTAHGSQAPGSSKIFDADLDGSRREPKASCPEQFRLTAS